MVGALNALKGSNEINFVLKYQATKLNQIESNIMNQLNSTLQPSTASSDLSKQFTKVQFNSNAMKFLLHSGKIVV